jgi:hypothetical protein
MAGTELREPREIFHPAREKSSMVASCKLPLGMPSFSRGDGMVT